MPKRIGLLGGTFDPVHKGHQSIADAFLHSDFIDELWILLTPFPPHKKTSEQASYNTRLEMLKAAFSNKNNLYISTVERSLPKPSYSYFTIKYLKSEYHDFLFYYCMGEDSLTQLKNWKYSNKIIEECELLVAERPGADHTNVEKSILERTHFVEHVPLEISSSQIKKKIKRGESVSDEVHEDVLKIIEKEQLYK